MEWNPCGMVRGGPLVLLLIPLWTGIPPELAAMLQNQCKTERVCLFMLWRRGKAPEIRVWPVSFTALVLVEVAGSSLIWGSIAGEQFSSLF